MICFLGIVAFSALISGLSGQYIPGGYLWILWSEVTCDVSGRETSKYGALTVFLSLINTIFVIALISGLSGQYIPGGYLWILWSEVTCDVSGRESSKYGALTVFLSLINTIFVKKNRFENHNNI